MRSVDGTIMTIGQYLQPTTEHLSLARFYHPNEYSALKEQGRALGFTRIELGPLVHSSHRAG
jgi:lipoyl synthase